MSRVIFIFLVLLTYWACHTDYLPPASYVRYIRDTGHGLKQRHDVQQITLEAFFEPPEYVALTSAGPGSLATSQLQKEIARNSGFYQFLFSIKSLSAQPIDEVLKEIGADAASFEKRKEDMEYRMQDAFILVCQGDTLPCTFYHAEAGGKIANAYKFILVFEGGKRSTGNVLASDLELFYDDRLWSGQQYAFQFDKNTINRLPKLKL